MGFRIAFPVIVSLPELGRTIGHRVDSGYLPMYFATKTSPRKREGSRNTSQILMQRKLLGTTKKRKENVQGHHTLETKLSYVY
jgi:hypothetical protein